MYQLWQVFIIIIIIILYCYQSELFQSVGFGLAIPVCNGNSSTTMSNKIYKKYISVFLIYLSEFLFGKNMIMPFMDSLATNYGYEETI